MPALDDALEPSEAAFPADGSFYGNKQAAFPSQDASLGEAHTGSRPGCSAPGMPRAAWACGLVCTPCSARLCWPQHQGIPSSPPHSCFPWGHSSCPDPRSSWEQGLPCEQCWCHDRAGTGQPRSSHLWEQHLGTAQQRQEETHRAGQALLTLPARCHISSPLRTTHPLPPQHLQAEH